MDCLSIALKFHQQVTEEIVENGLGVAILFQGESKMGQCVFRLIQLVERDGEPSVRFGGGVLQRPSQGLSICHRRFFILSLRA